MAKLRLMRPDEKTNQQAEMVIYLNGKVLGTLGNNETKEFEVAEGCHKVKASIDTQGSKAHRFKIASSETKDFIISTNNEANSPEPLVGSSVLLDAIVSAGMLLYYFTIGHNRYLTISEIK